MYLYHAPATASPYTEDASKETTPFISTAELQPLEAPRKRRILSCINLTNGLEALPALRSVGVGLEDVCFMRLQSTKAEQHDMEYILEQVSDHDLDGLARGTHVQASTAS